MITNYPPRKVMKNYLSKTQNLAKLIQLGKMRKQREYLEVAYENHDGGNDFKKVRTAYFLAEEALLTFATENPYITAYCLKLTLCPEEMTTDELITYLNV